MSEALVESRSVYVEVILSSWCLDVGLEDNTASCSIKNNLDANCNSSNTTNLGLICVCLIATVKVKTINKTILLNFVQINPKICPWCTAALQLAGCCRLAAIPQPRLPAPWPVTVPAQTSVASELLSVTERPESERVSSWCPGDRSSPL